MRCSKPCPCLTTATPRGEYYLTDAIEILLRGGRRAGVFEALDSDEILGANTQSSF